HYNNVSDTYDPATATVEKFAWAPATVRGYFYDTKEEPSFETQVETGNRRVLLMPTDINGMNIRKPQASDRIEGQREQVSISEVEEII
ncbi:hypothetical protein ACXWSA_09505, partial [Streptococcus pyogenes]